MRSMLRRSLFAVAALVPLVHAPVARAITVDPFYSGSYSATDLGSASGLPAPYGGLTFKAGDSNTILIGGTANNAGGDFYSVPVTRGAGSHITSLGPATFYSGGAFNDGGLAYGPGDVLFYSRYPTNQVGEIKPGSSTVNKVVDLTPLGIASSTGALNFVPAGFNGAGELKVVSYNSGGFYNVTFAPDGTGTFNLTGATLKVTLTGGPEGFIYVPIGSPLFPLQSLLMSEYGTGKVAAYEIDADGNPIFATRKDFVTGLSGAEGAVIDPLTGDFLFSTFGGGNHVIEVQGFAAPAPAPVPEPGTLVLVATGALNVIGYAFRRARLG